MPNRYRTCIECGHYLPAHAPNCPEDDGPDEEEAGETLDPEDSDSTEDDEP